MSTLSWYKLPALWSRIFTSRSFLVISLSHSQLSWFHLSIIRLSCRNWASVSKLRKVDEVSIISNPSVPAILLNSQI